MHQPTLQIKSAPSADEAKAKLDALLQNAIKQNQMKKNQDVEKAEKIDLAKPKKNQKIVRPDTEGMHSVIRSN